MNDAATQEKSEKENPGPVVAAADAQAVAIWCGDSCRIRHSG